MDEEDDKSVVGRNIKYGSIRRLKAEGKETEAGKGNASRKDERHLKVDNRFSFRKRLQKLR